MAEVMWTAFIVPNGGINETQSQHQIEDKEWADAQNAEPLPDGVRRRQGRTRQNTAAMNTDNVTCIHDYRHSDGSTTRHLVVCGGTVYKNVGGVMTSVSGTDGFTYAATRFESAATGQDRAKFANGTDVSKQFYVTGGTEYWENEGISAPTTTPTFSAAAGGSLATGTWYVDYYYYNSRTGHPSNKKFQGTDATTHDVALTAGNQTIAVTGLPTDVVRSGDAATHLRISLKSPSGTVYRFAGTGEGEITLGTTTANITSDTTGDPVEYDYDVPPTHAIKCVAENRQFIAGYDDNPERVGFSKISGTAAYYDAIPPRNFRDFGKKDGDVVKALFYVPPQTVVVGGKNNVWAIDARRPGTSDQYVLARGVGIANHNAGVVVGRQLFFISDADRAKGPHVWDGSSVRPILGIDDTFKGLNQTRIEYVSAAHYAPDNNRWQWWVLCSAAGSSVFDRILVYDYILDSWSVYTTANASVLGEAQASGVNQLFIGGTAGWEYLADSGTDDQNAVGADDTEFEGYIKGKAFDFGLTDAVKRLRFIRYVALGQTSGGINLSITADYGDKPTFSESLGHISRTASVLGTGVLGSFVLGSNSDLMRRQSLHGVGRSLQPQFSGTDPWHIKGLSFGVQPTKRRS